MGVELDPEYFEIARTRIAEAMADAESFIRPTERLDLFGAA